jgi:hypothetical protein
VRSTLPRRTKSCRYEEDKAQEQEYATRLLRDMVAVTVDRDQITTQEAIAKLREIPTSPWRRFRGDGLKDGIEGAMVLAGLLSRFGVKPATIRIAPKNLGTGSTAKGYKRQALLKALNEIEQAGSARVLEPAPRSLTSSQRRRSVTSRNRRRTASTGSSSRTRNRMPCGT